MAPKVIRRDNTVQDIPTSSMIIETPFNLGVPQ